MGGCREVVQPVTCGYWPCCGVGQSEAGGSKAVGEEKVEFYTKPGQVCRHA